MHSKIPIKTPRAPFVYTNNNWGCPLKRPLTVGGGDVRCGHFADKGEGVLQMRMPALFGTKNSGFFLEIYGASARTRRGLNHCGHFTDNGDRFFAILCGRRLCTAHLGCHDERTCVQCKMERNTSGKYESQVEHRSCHNSD